MHELSIVQALLEQVEEALPPDHRLLLVRIRVGELEHLDADVMDEVVSVAVADTPLRTGRLEVVRVPLEVRCRACETLHRPEDVLVLACPACGEVRPEITAGSGVLLQSIEAERVDPGPGES